MKARPNVAFHKDTGRWCAYVSFLGRRHHLGLHDTEDLAGAAALAFKLDNDIEPDESAPLISRVTYSAGLLVWRLHGRGHRKGDVVGSVDKTAGYVFTRNESGAKVYVHRLVWMLLRGPIPQGMEIDHVNGDRADNRIENLRLVTRDMNLKNTRLRTNNSTGCPGVSVLPSGRFLARMGDGGKTIRIGAFDTSAEAIAARNAAAQAHGYHPNHGRKSA